jgi:hypothetical protein
VILARPEVTLAELRQRTGWDMQPEGLCKGDRCIPLPDATGTRIDAHVLSDRVGMELVHDPEHELWALGPEAGGRALASAELPDITLPDRHGQPFSLRSLRGTKVLLVMWASW